MDWRDSINSVRAKSQLKRGTCKDGAQHGQSEMDLGGCSSDVKIDVATLRARRAEEGGATRWQGHDDDDLGALTAGVENVGCVR